MCFRNEEHTNKCLGRASLSIDQLTDSEMKALMDDYRHAAHKYLFSSDDYLEQLTAKWKTPEAPERTIHSDSLIVHTDTDLYWKAREEENAEKRKDTDESDRQVRQ